MNEKPTTVIDTCEDSVIHKDKVQQASARKLDESTFDALAETFKILSNQTRLKLIQALSHDELVAKFKANVAFGEWSDRAANELQSFCEDLTKTNNLKELGKFRSPLPEATRRLTEPRT